MPGGNYPSHSAVWHSSTVQSDGKPRVKTVARGGWFVCDASAGANSLSGHLQWRIFIEWEPIGPFSQLNFARLRCEPWLASLAFLALWFLFMQTHIREVFCKTLCSMDPGYLLFSSLCTITACTIHPSLLSMATHIREVLCKTPCTMDPGRLSFSFFCLMTHQLLVHVNAHPRSSLQDAVDRGPWLPLVPFSPSYDPPINPICWSTPTHIREVLCKTLCSMGLDYFSFPCSRRLSSTTYTTRVFLVLLLAHYGLHDPTISPTGLSMETHIREVLCKTPCIMGPRRLFLFVCLRLLVLPDLPLHAFLCDSAFTDNRLGQLGLYSATALQLLQLF
ncbi:hypothetical protein HGRIS_002956 [Hohenbuehelia grisea]|uniref:Uncharacterized protein n=1 Tax=Hohenbuehelia grisea TaxID=104357 RepID=A0ABR3JN97_9AGAR